MGGKRDVKIRLNRVSQVPPIRPPFDVNKGKYFGDTPCYSQSGDWELSISDTHITVRRPNRYASTRSYDIRALIRPYSHSSILIDLYRTELFFVTEMREL